MAKKIIKRVTQSATKPAAKNAVKKTLTPVSPRSVALAGVGASVTAIERVQSEAMRVYTTLAKQAEALRNMTAEAAESLSEKSGVFVREGQKIQSQAAAVAQAQANATAKEVSAFAKKAKRHSKPTQPKQ